MSIDVETFQKKLKEKFMVDVSEEEVHDLIHSGVHIIRGGQPVSITEITCSRASVVSGLSDNSHSAALQKPCNDEAPIQKEADEKEADEAAPIQKEDDEKEADEEILYGIKDVLDEHDFTLNLECENSDLDEATKHLDLRENNFEMMGQKTALKTLANASSNKAPIPISDSLTAGSSLAASSVSVSD